LMQRQFC